MSNSYKTIHWGLLILAFNFYIGGINIFPDFLALMLISKGLNELNSEEVYFYKGKAIAKIMVGITLIQYIVSMFINNDIVRISEIGVVFFTISNLINAVNLIIIYYILKGIYLEAEKQKLTYFMGKVKGIWNFKLIISLMVFLVCAFIINDGSFVRGINPIVAIGAVIAQLRVAFVVNEADKQLI